MKRIILFSLLLFCSLLFAEVYKWTDANGKVNYGDKPQHPNATAINVAPEPPVNNDLKQRQTETQAKRKQAENQQEIAATDAKAKAEMGKRDAQIEEACKRQQENMATLSEYGARAYTVMSDGETHYLSDEDRKKQIDSTQAFLDKYCKGVTPSNTK